MFPGDVNGKNWRIRWRKRIYKLKEGLEKSSKNQDNIPKRDIFTFGNPVGYSSLLANLNYPLIVAYS